jgi:hypothetical protein
MTAPAHITDEQIAQFRDGTLAPSELLELDEHVAGCLACRGRLASSANAFSGIRSLRAEVAGHLEYEGIVACSEGMASPKQRAHLQECAMCQAEVQDLGRFRSELHDTPRARKKATVVPIARWTKWTLPAAVAAAVLLIAGGAVWNARRHRAVEQAAATAPKPVEAPLPPAEKASLDRAMAARRFERAPVLDQLIVHPNTLLGSKSEATTLDLLTPVGTTVLSDRPTMRWTPLLGATGYVVAIFNTNFEKIAESPVQTGTDWTVGSALPRGQVLSWQVTADVRGKRVRAPQPPAREARFEVVSKETADRIAAIAQQHPGDSLLRAVLYANAGALDEAEEALRAMDSESAQRYRESIRNIRNPE